MFTHGVDFQGESGGTVDAMQIGDDIEQRVVDDNDIDNRYQFAIGEAHTTPKIWPL